jgi:hypothetical protein
MSTSDSAWFRQLSQLTDKLSEFIRPFLRLPQTSGANFLAEFHGTVFFVVSRAYWPPSDLDFIETSRLPFVVRPSVLEILLLSDERLMSKTSGPQRGRSIEDVSERSPYRPSSTSFSCCSSANSLATQAIESILLMGTLTFSICNSMSLNTASLGVFLPLWRCNSCQKKSPKSIANSSLCCATYQIRQGFAAAFHEIGRWNSANA